jgi:cation:H+ antiporter
MLTSIVLLVVGLALLVLGGDLLVRGASALALLARVTPAVVGLTVVAAGTSMPELVVSTRAALADNPALAAGNVVGSNIFNIAAILGVTALLRPLRVLGNAVRLEWPVMMLAAFQFHLLARDGVIDRLEGAFLLSAMVAFTAYVVWIARRNATSAEQAAFGDLGPAPERNARGWLINGLWVGLGIGLLMGGASALVEGAVGIATGLGVSQVVIALTVVAAGTSLPELAASLMGAYRGKDDIAVANVLGSNVFNVLAILGVTGLIKPLPVPAELIARDNLWMLALSAVLLPLMRSGMRIDRIEGGLLLAAFACYMAVLAGAF